MVICTLVCHLIIPGCHSLKEKRSQVKPLVNRVHREFNVSVSEIDLQDKWDEVMIGCALVSNQRVIAEKQIQQVAGFIDKYWKDLQLIDYKIEFY
jgi:uncharacterized protein YlxP (DUF503 family)